LQSAIIATPNGRAQKRLKMSYFENPDTLPRGNARFQASSFAGLWPMLAPKAAN
jgi:hypothetical protein